MVSPVQVQQAKELVREYLREWLPVIRQDQGAIEKWLSILTKERMFRPHVTYDTDGQPTHGVLVFDDTKARAVIEDARRGDRIADRVLRALASRYLRELKALPDGLAQYVADIVDGKAPKPKGGVLPNAERSRCLLRAIEQIVTANPEIVATTAEHSACAIVSQVLVELGYFIEPTALKRIWDKRAPE